MTRLYISGPVTGIPNYNREAFEEARKELRSEYIVDIPHDCVDAGTPHEEAMTTLIHQLTATRYSPTTRRSASTATTALRSYPAGSSQRARGSRRPWPRPAGYR